MFPRSTRDRKEAVKWAAIGILVGVFAPDSWNPVVQIKRAIQKAR